MALPSMLCVIPILNGRKLHIHRYTLLPQWKGSNNGGVIFMFWISAFHFLKEIIYVLTQSKLTWLHTYIKYLHMYHMFILREQIKNSDLMVGFFFDEKRLFDMIWHTKFLNTKSPIYEMKAFSRHFLTCHSYFHDEKLPEKCHGCSQNNVLSCAQNKNFYFLVEIHKNMHLL